MTQLQKLEQMFASGSISRREFISRVSALGLTAALSPVFLKTAAHAASPRRGGRFRAGIVGGASGDSLAPDRMLGVFNTAIAWGQLRNCLVEIDADNLPQPELAKSWEASADAKRWVFELRRGVEFHNGKTMDAEDVAFSINLHRREESKSGAKGFLKPVADIRADGKHKVVFELISPNVDFPYVLSDYNLQIVPNNTEDLDKAVGTGGYMLVEYEPGVRALTKRNPNYWKEGRAWFDEVETLGISDPVARISALRSGKVDFVQDVDMKMFDMVKNVPGIQGIEVLGFMHFTFGMRTDIPPFNDNNARLALKYALDREQVLKQILRGHGVMGNDHPISPSYPFHNSELPQRTFDPDKARYYVKKAGLENYTFDIHTAETGFPGSTDTAMIYKENAKKAGINLKINKAPEDGYWSEIWGIKPLTACYWGGRPTEESMFTQCWEKGAPWDRTRWVNERFNSLLAQARAEFDREKRREMFWEMQQLARDEGGRVVLAFAPFLDAASDKVKFNKIACNWFMDGTKCFERWWFAA